MRSYSVIHWDSSAEVLKTSCYELKIQYLNALGHLLPTGLCLLLRLLRMLQWRSDYIRCFISDYLPVKAFSGVRERVTPHHAAPEKFSSAHRPWLGNNKCLFRASRPKACPRACHRHRPRLCPLELELCWEGPTLTVPQREDQQEWSNESLYGYVSNERTPGTPRELERAQWMF